MFPQQHGVVALASKQFHPFKSGGSRTHLTLASQLESLGYRTVAYGKSHLG